MTNELENTIKDKTEIIDQLKSLEVIKFLKVERGNFFDE